MNALFLSLVRNIFDDIIIVSGNSVQSSGSVLMQHCALNVIDLDKLKKNCKV